MDTFSATMIAEGSYEPKDEDEYYEAWQSLIDTGVVWQLQGFFGRTATRLIAEGKCKSFTK